LDAGLIIFYFLAAVTVGASLCVVLPPFGRNPLHAALALLVAFFFLSGLFVMLSAHLVAVLQVLVYAGAVMVLFTFVVMLLNLQRHELAGPHVTAWKALGAAAVVVIAAKVGIAVSAALADAPVADLSCGDEGFGGVRDVGGQLLMGYLFPFELVSVLLLVAIVGALLLARRSRRGEGGAA
jgi:NADH-quinone oxidoreductase subunit J